MTLLEKADQLLQLGLSQRATGDNEEALQNYLRALTLYRQLNRPDRLIIVLNNLGAVKQLLGDRNRAESFYLEALKLSTQTNNLQGESLSTGNLATIEEEKGNLTKAKNLLEHAIQICEQTQNLPGAATHYGNLGLLYLGLGEHQEAQLCFRKAMIAFKKTGNPSGEAGVLRCLSDSLCREGKIEEAQQAIEHSFVLSKESGDLIGEAYSRRALGQLHQRKGNPKDAIGHYRASFYAHKELGDKRGQSGALLDLGTAKAALGKFGEAETNLRHSVKIAKEIKFIEGEAGSLMSLSNLLVTQGKLQEARTGFKEAETLFKKLHNPRGQAAVTINQLQLSLIDGNWENLEKTIAHVKELLITHNLGSMMPNLNGIEASLKHIKGDFTGALDSLNQALEEFNQIGDSKSVHLCQLTNLNYLMQAGQSENILEELNALKIKFNDQKLWESVAETNQAIANYYRLTGDYQTALDYYEKAEQHFKNFNLVAGLLSLAINKIDTLLRIIPIENPGPTNTQTLLKAEQELEKAFEYARKLKATPRIILLLAYQADILRRKGDLKKAFTLCKQALDQSKTLSYPYGKGNALNILGRWAYDQQDYEQMEHFYTESINTLRLCGALFAASETEQEFLILFKPQNNVQ